MESGEVVVEGDGRRECYDRRTDKVEPETNIVQNVCGEINVSAASALYLRTYTLQGIFVEPGGTGKSGVWNRISCLTFMALLL